MLSNTLGRRNIEKDVERLLVASVAAPSLYASPIINVKWWGAEGDGGDDSVAIQNAVDVAMDT
ncbi:MAG: hypothetical protein ACYSYU_10615, partial [Planctomycetota bacterium]